MRYLRRQTLRRTRVLALRPGPGSWFVRANPPQYLALRMQILQIPASQPQRAAKRPTDVRTMMFLLRLADTPTSLHSLPVPEHVTLAPFPASPLKVYLDLGGTRCIAAKPRFCETLVVREFVEFELSWV